MDKALSIGELAERSGISVRALRLYEAEGLIKPVRTQAGRRVYQADDVARLQQILLLKKTGCTLGQIGHLLDRRPFDPARLIDAQIDALEQTERSLARTLGLLRAARRQLCNGECLSVDALCDLIKLGEQSMSEENWKPVLDRYYTAAEQEKWREAKAAFSPQGETAYVRQWSELIAEIEAAIACKVTPADEHAQRLAVRWYELQKPLVEKVGVEVWNKASRMYQEMDQWQTPQVQAPFSAAVYEFAVRAADAARANGLIPPRQPG
ncbi:MerR family transcriptional regulator [Niveispirillum lacus]|nr:MerR family transcriptional regulator [Niveispirillum lacus]